MRPSHSQLLQKIKQEVEDGQFGTAATRKDKNIFRIGEQHTLNIPTEKMCIGFSVGFESETKTQTILNSELVLRSFWRCTEGKFAQSAPLKGKLPKAVRRPVPVQTVTAAAESRPQSVTAPPHSRPLPRVQSCV